MAETQDFQITNTLDDDEANAVNQKRTTTIDNINPKEDTISRIMDASDFNANDVSLIFQLSFYFENSELFLVVRSGDEKLEEKFKIMSDDQKTFDLLAEKITESVTQLYNVFPKKADYKKAKKRN
jgi:hypothetical protein